MLYKAFLFSWVMCPLPWPSEFWEPLGMGISLYAMFIALLVPTLKKSGKVATVAGLSAMINWVLIAEFQVSGGWSIVSATVLASAFGALVYKGGRY